MNPLANFKYCPICGSKHFVDNDARSKRCLDCGFTFYLNAASAVAALIVNDKDELLLCQRKFEPYKGTL
ncbi:MAG TPA: DNA mismatch repair protein MutT, partial [Paludibacteraceae bacterium]|nr:DNA mismatch repair protein MutT [Paludibacteraceae bacterium]